MKNYSVKLIKVKSNHSNLRTDEVVGLTNYLPTKNEVFRMLGQPLYEGGPPRAIMTSPVVSVSDYDGVITFSTINSEYKLEYLEIIG